MKHSYLVGLCLILLFDSCVLPRPDCFWEFPDFEKTYEFDISKEELKNKIVDAYTYNKSLLLKNFGLSLVENDNVNFKYQRNTNTWLDKSNWNREKQEIRRNTSDTLNLLICKHHTLKEIKLIAIINGGNEKSSLTIKNLEYVQRKTCKKNKEYYKIKISKKIEQVLIKKLK